jgi:chemotaxis regulatin CheY-phosphate phosphatase CheZ
MPTPIRARDVRANITELGYENGTLKSLEALAEEQSSMRITLREMAQMLARCIDAVDNMVNVGDAMGAKLKEIERRDEQYRDTGHIPPDDRG